jgi:regulator of cell morphogenesis and NO signaling
MFRNSTLKELVDEDAVRGYVLYNFGIKFYESEEATLGDVCQQLGLKVEQVENEIVSAKQFQEGDLPLKSYPVDLIIEYLKHSHLIFIKYKLPYIGKLVESFQAAKTEYSTIAKDLKILFPLFAEDFIEHIYHEEDTLFTYIHQLEKSVHNRYNYGELYYQMENNSLQLFATQHEAHDDEMAGIRKITKEYCLAADSPLHVKVIYAELMQFEKSLQTHATIENEILFPKAMMLENKVRRMLAESSKYN